MKIPLSAAFMSRYTKREYKLTENWTREPKGDTWIIYIYIYILCTNILIIIIIMLIMLHMRYITIIIFFITILTQYMYVIIYYIYIAMPTINYTYIYIYWLYNYFSNILYCWNITFVPIKMFFRNCTLNSPSAVCIAILRTWLGSQKGSHVAPKMQHVTFCDSIGRFDWCRTKRIDSVCGGNMDTPMCERRICNLMG